MPLAAVRSNYWNDWLFTRQDFRFAALRQGFRILLAQLRNDEVLGISRMVGGPSNPIGAVIPGRRSRARNPEIGKWIEIPKAGTAKYIPLTSELLDSGPRYAIPE
jgi:hypothetical protein